MSWQAAGLVILALGLLGGAWWYERSRPPAQVVALVATLAALAAAGRVALSPVPNVVPTTDIALLSGYALGGPPGFAVGSLAALASNFWLGQGPWTPWQMAGWGLVGVVGAALAVATGRHLGRVGLAIACGVCGFAFGALMDLSLMVTYGGEQSLDRFLAISTRSLPFNFAHAAGNVAFALVAGPALARMLLRYRSRFEFAWARRRRGSRARRRNSLAGAASVLAAVAVAASAAPGPEARASDPGGRAAAAPAAEPAARTSSAPAAAAAWLRARQNPDGGFAAEPGSDSAPSMTGWVALAMEARGVHPASLSRGGASVLDYLRSTANEISTTGDIERTILVLAAAGLSPRKFEGRDLVGRLLRRRGGDGSWGGQVNPTAFGILALEAAGRTGGNARSAAWLRGAANGDGGWGFVKRAQSDPDSTGAVLQALTAGGGSGGALAAGVRYLRGAQRGGGGFALSGGQVNAQSTAWAVQGLIAAGVRPRKVRSGGRSPLDYLASLRAGDGHYRYSRSSDHTPVWVTAQALLAVSSAEFPLPRVSAFSLGASTGSGGDGAVAGAGTASGSAGSAPDGGGGAASSGPAGAGDAAESPAGVGAAAEAAAGTAAAADVKEAGARYESDGAQDRTPLIVGAVAAFALAALGALGMRRQRAGR